MKRFEQDFLRDLFLGRAASGSQDHDAADQGYGADNGRDWDGFVFFFGGLDGPNIQYFLVSRVGDALIGQHQDPNHDQNNSGYSHVMNDATGAPSR